MSRLSLVILLLFLAGCAGIVEKTKSAGKSLESGIIDMMSTSEEDESAPPRELAEIVEEVSLTPVWQQKASEGKGSKYLKLEMVVSDGKLFVADLKGKVLAIDQMTGELIWEVKTELPISGGLEVGYEHVFFGTTDADVVALKLNDGDTAWTSQVSSEVLSTPRFSDGLLVVRSVDGAVNTLDAANGEERWSYIRDVPALSLRGTSSPVVKSGGVICGYANGKLVVLRLKDGLQIWETSVAVARGRGALSRMVDVDSDPLAGERYIYAATFNGGVVAVDVRSGQIVWRRSEMSSYKKMIADWVSIYVVDVNNHLWSADQNDGSINWLQDSLEHRQLTPLTQAGDYLLTADYEGYLHVINSTDGALVGRLRVSDVAISTAPIIDDGLIYVQDIEGVITALRMDTLSVTEE
ncbi:MAG: outer membrane protein assembly factor BamB [Cycloclasticus pugetii]|jgi:outer membrane protein assembly factor BamB|uniref:Outer membrane protein assembly factor BamB n=1 Tax=Cycloclasticus zancles 78-ME TaxID=1198232 RepID=S5TYQ8_9GAMM|nr:MULTISPECIES: outer membrane protein assembly factor BamB [Cycloclasticus]AFT66647.1 serine/threonine protein kinase with quinoprotein alcohol dehydrogenase domain [Cycloclasticus sp. P1]AGS40305.1 Serine/threonine protein kinase with quinoprotein alcohol dehydrogenase domain [Cycloclasticus zancles 78-ME]MBV1898210.1 outer membrane protein assembly factor BamB [Cycloclasticus sp.]PHR51876.1 MAG: outer membrane protein assembly factor BamB [Cycloclasticus sp.]SHI96690.1 Beta-barrel assembly|tara:strand:- start:5020 stop:6246 length:1227 start_codon:yes stop_codon:yes gene_type:complete